MIARHTTDETMAAWYEIWNTYEKWYLMYMDSGTAKISRPSSVKREKKEVNKKFWTWLTINSTDPDVLPSGEWEGRTFSVKTSQEEIEKMRNSILHSSRGSCSGGEVEQHQKRTAIIHKIFGTKKIKFKKFTKQFSFMYNSWKLLQNHVSCGALEIIVDFIKHKIINSLKH